ncbi:hypothetical protein AB0I94_34580 [Streptomyces sp. NPDC050147]|uniref:hypothetical protein n=1 Tax=Streptomyces sp. NPDC050147 TaxID=3155513 RepID=UPI00343F2C4F
MNTSHLDTNVVHRLNAEWRRLCDRTIPAARLRGWLIEAGVLDEHAPHRLDELHDHLQQQSKEQGRHFSDLWLTVLPERADGEGEQAQLAARVVVQAMLPGAVRMTQRCQRDGEAFADVAQVVIASLYQVVRLSRSRGAAGSWHGICACSCGTSFRVSWGGSSLPAARNCPARATRWPATPPDPLAQAEVVLLASAAQAVGLYSADEPVEEPPARGANWSSSWSGRWQRRSSPPMPCPRLPITTAPRARSVTLRRPARRGRARRPSGKSAGAPLQLRTAAPLWLTAA